ncbi:DUF2867 domain-containing protein [Streptomyces sp. NPDC007369]|uniref:DUF2867 domain-containing protein n=1 Tax=Streptomyces sp. NPDC007369 TaxID=3154589 RepID=UPI00340F7E87
MKKMKMPRTAHTSRPWRIHDVARDFRVEDVWALPTPGGPGDLPLLVDWFTEDDGPNPFSGAARVLFAIRLRLGKIAGWDGAGTGIGSRVPSLRTRLPEDLREGPRGPDLPSVPFTSVYLTDTEWAAESANRTVHTVLHVGWVPDGTGGHRGEMTVLVKPNGLLGRAYMAAVAPFRHLIVYPALMGMIRRGWRAKTAAGSSSRPTGPADLRVAARPLTVRQRHDVPAEVRALVPADSGYVDLFTLTAEGASRRSPEQWARALFEDVAGRQGQFIWRVLLGLRLRGAPSASASAQHVAGWRIAERRDGRIRLEAHSWMLTGHLVVDVQDDQVSLATVVRYRRSAAARIWPPLATVHRRLAPGLLRDAHRILNPAPRL